MTKKTAATIIAEFLCWDLPDVTAQRYQPTVYYHPAIYAISLKDGTEYLVSPPAGKAMPKVYAGMNWYLVGTHWQGREIWGANGESAG